MLSVCIPVYNFDVRALVYDLHEQAMTNKISFEIILMDDASEVSYTACLQELPTLPHVRVIALPENIGRSKIRNAMVKEAQYPYIIFIDCDSATASKNYIAQYLPFCKPNAVVYGGCCYEQKKPSDTTFLRWKYGIKRESALASERKKYPNFSFRTNNFLIDKAIFNTVTFNEKIEGYGHEDTLFGLELLAHHIPILHIDNPLIHLGLETADVFLKKTEQAVKNLNYLVHQNIISKENQKGIKLLRFSIFCQKIKIKSLVLRLFHLFKNPILKNLTGKKPHLCLLDFYKLECYLIHISKKNKECRKCFFKKSTVALKIIYIFATIL